MKELLPCSQQQRIGPKLALGGAEMRNSATSALIFAMVAVSTIAQNYRLPLNVIPSHYDIELLVKLDPEENFTFSGIVSIHFTCVQATDTVILHNFLLTVDEANVVLQDKSGTSMGIDRHEYDWDYAQFQTISLTKSLMAGQDYRLTIPYSGVMVTSEEGLFYGSYVGDSGELEYFAGTQLQPTSARALFPCFDEPGLKATFCITVGHPNKYHAFTNMPLTKSAVDSVSPNIIWDYHETSVVMSTYLVAIIVGDFTRVPTSDPRQFILVRDEVTNLTRDAAVFVPTILNEMETRLSTPFPLPKLDHAGVFGFNGGMENYGLIFYAETDVAGIDGSASLTLMAHETSHMWTGNLVTCQWWDVAWLNEGMTHFFTYLISEKVDPSFPYLDLLGTQLMDNAMDFDLEPTAPPMVVPISEPADIVTGFAEELIYNRGGNIGRVMYLLLGDEIFMEGMKNYFADNQFQSVREEHLFTALNNAAEAAGLGLKYSVSELITPFSNQAGFPLVTVTNTGAKVDGKSVYSVSQRRLLNATNNEHDDDTLWPIALTWATSSNPNFDDKNPKTYLTEASTTVTIDGDDDWVLFNNRRSGYYRVNYDTVTWNKILDALKTSRGIFPNTNVAAIISDGLRLCLLGLVDPDVCERIPKNLMDERSLIVWLTAAKNLHKAIARVADKTAELSRIKEIVKNAEFNALKTREAMTPERESLLELLRNFSKHLEEPNATRAFISSHEEFWNKLFEKQKQNLKKRLSSRKYPHQKFQN